MEVERKLNVGFALNRARFTLLTSQSKGERKLQGGLKYNVRVSRVKPRTRAGIEDIW